MASWIWPNIDAAVRMSVVFSRIVCGAEKAKSQVAAVGNSVYNRNMAKHR